MAQARKVYLDASTGKYYALYAGESVSSFVVEDGFPVGETIITHGKNTKKIIPRLYTDQQRELTPNNFKIVDSDNVSITFNEPFTGKIKLLFFI